MIDIKAGFYTLMHRKDIAEVVKVYPDEYLITGEGLRIRAIGFVGSAYVRWDKWGECLEGYHATLLKHIKMDLKPPGFYRTKSGQLVEIFKTYPELFISVGAIKSDNCWCRREWGNFGEIKNGTEESDLEEFLGEKNPEETKNKLFFMKCVGYPKGEL